ncbi:hypothetical protein LZ24_00849 [Desulfobotulus alkaliphilus]|uniref:Uncharacterized protein n=1 Tax=Desulfobotulus alkaliphilus TaxID=622671 RepID=A0A562S235_9BACT|nr:hypothetical protein [Desulfobotulus alkaliphilus]TWI75397.1 hypothetical protein LZ24_00849 [Desulfobotulus alkaliphilus]
MKKKRISLAIGIFLFFSASSILLSGCNATEGLSDDNSKEARIEKGLMALDRGNYAEAEKVFENLVQSHPTDQQIRSYHASAIAGGAGMDVFNFMETLDYLDKKGTDNNDTIELIGRTLTRSSGQPKITKNEIGRKILSFEKAMNTLLELTGNNYLTWINAGTNIKAMQSKTYASNTQKNPASPTLLLADAFIKLNDDQKIQIGLIALNHAVLVIGDIIMEDLTLDSLILTEKEIRDLYAHQSYQVNFSHIVDFLKEDKILEKLSFDIAIANQTVEAILRMMNIGEQQNHQIKDAFNTFMEALDNGRGGGTKGDGFIERGELEYYLSNL